MPNTCLGEKTANIIPAQENDWLLKGILGWGQDQISPYDLLYCRYFSLVILAAIP